MTVGQNNDILIITKMHSRIEDLFTDITLTEKIKRRLPHLFYYAERDSSRAGKVGMEVGSLRERIIVSLLMYKFGRQNVESELPITEHEVDVKLFREALSIKTVTTSGPNIGSVKAIWTVDAAQASKFVTSYYPSCDYLVVHIAWEKHGGFYYVPVEAQRAIFDSLGRHAYLKPPKPGTNPRGVEVTSEAMRQIIHHDLARGIPISWQKPEGQYDPFSRWIEYWSLD